MRSKLILFCILAYFITWGSKFLMSASDLGWISTVIPKGFIQLSAQFGPTIAGLVVIFLTGRGKGILIILKNLTNFRLKLKWYLFALLFELILFILVLLVSVILGIVHVESSSTLMLSSFIKFIWSTINLTLLTGLGEEIGWRGFLLPKLQSSLPVLIASVVMALIISFWHLRTNDLTTLLSGDWHGFLISFLPDMGQRIVITIPVTFIIVYLFNKTRGSLFIMILYHGASNASYEWVKEITQISDPSFLLPVFTLLLWISSLFFIPAIIKQGRNKELVTTIQ